MAGFNPNLLQGFKYLLEPRFPSLPCRPFWFVLFSGFIFIFLLEQTRAFVFIQTSSLLGSQRAINP